MLLFGDGWTILLSCNYLSCHIITPSLVHNSSTILILKTHMQSQSDSDFGLRILTLWLFNSSPWKMAHRNRWFTYEQHGDFPWPTVSHNQMVCFIRQYSISNSRYLLDVQHICSGFHVRCQNKTCFSNPQRNSQWFIKTNHREHGHIFFVQRLRTSPLNATGRKRSFWGMVYEIFWELYEIT